MTVSLSKIALGYCNSTMDAVCKLDALIAALFVRTDQILSMLYTMRDLEMGSLQQDNDKGDDMR